MVCKKCVLSLLIIYFAGLMPAGRCQVQKPLLKPAAPKAAIEFRATAYRAVVHGKQPVYINLFFKNVTAQDVYLRLWITPPVPFGTNLTDLHCLLMRCRNQATGKEVQYTWWPPQLVPAYVQRKESLMTEEIRPGKTLVTPLPLRYFCVLPPGKYTVELQYDTRFIPSWIKPDKRAWHGITDKETVNIQVVR
jgi:hypothetical protein